MRSKIIAVNAVIVLIVGLLSYVLVRLGVSAAATNTDQLQAEARHDAQGASARVQLDGLRAERWLAAKASEPATNEPLTKADPSARGESATQVCDAILAQAKAAPAFEGKLPSLVVLVDREGRIVGRNGSNLGRGEDLSAVYPGLKAALRGEQSGSEVWADRSRNDQFLASFAPVRDEAGRASGALVIAMTLNDVLSRASEAGRGLLVVVPDGEGHRVVATSAATAAGQADTALGRGKDAITRAFGSGRGVAMPVDDSIVAAAPLDGFADGKRAAVVLVSPASLIPNATGLASPVLGAMALGIILVLVGGVLLGNYITRPINQLEEGLLAILNGQPEKRFELQHDELGGLAFRIDQLLNQLMGVEEDTTDEDGRPSKAPTTRDFADAMAVDQGRDELDPSLVVSLAAEPPDVYYGRLYREYIAAKRALGEPTEHITEATFSNRIQAMERDASSKYGKNVRYHVKPTPKEVVLIAVPLP
jgi:hypothetical protein